MSDVDNLMMPTMSEEMLRALNEAKTRVRASYGENTHATGVTAFPRQTSLYCTEKSISAG